MPSLPAASFVLDRQTHWAELDQEERPRQEALAEFIATESNYYQRLTVLYEVFYHQLADILPQGPRKAIFHNLDELLLCSGLFLSDLRARQVAQNGVISCVSDIFLQHVHIPGAAQSLHLSQLKKFECFKTYCIGHAEGNRLVQELSISNSRFSRFLKEVVHDPRCCSLDLGSFLLEPVQRLARYPLLLKQILHYTARDSAQHEQVLEAVRRSEKYLQEVNESVRDHESLGRLEYYQERILQPVAFTTITETQGGQSGILDLVGLTRNGQNRMLLLETPLWKCRSKRKIVGLLLSDMIILLEKHGADRFSLYRQPLSLTEITLRDINFDALKLKLAKENCFEIARGAESVCIATETLGERQKWLDCFFTARTKLTNPPATSKIPLSLPCIGTVKITVINGLQIPVAVDAETCCVLALNNQKVELRQATGPNPTWNHSEVLCLASYDDYLRLSVLSYRKWAPNEIIGYADLSLNFLEYYNERATQKIDLDLLSCNGRPSRSAAKVSVTLQYRSM